MKQLLFVLLLAAAGSAMAADGPVKSSDGILVDQQGMTLYTFDKDTANSGKSACNDACAKAWPPLHAKDGAKASGELTIIKRDDGTRQWAHDGKPLYLYRSDKAAGDRKGDGFKDIWHVVKD